MITWARRHCDAVAVTGASLSQVICISRKWTSFVTTIFGFIVKAHKRAVNGLKRTFRYVDSEKDIRFQVENSSDFMH
jgi:hypothetical protein